MKPFTEELRYEFTDITPDDIVLDIGCYEGRWADEMMRRYGCRVIAFEPCSKFREAIAKRFSGNDRFTLMDYAVGGSSGEMDLKIKGDMTGFWADGPSERVKIHSISDVLNDISGQVACVKINAEGSEYPIMETVVRDGMATESRNWQIQFHQCVPDFERRYDVIQKELQKTHALTYFAHFCWENWELKR
jgi:FkbM family methyltransferase